jgi:transcriptional regulator with XRE-family HTH domain
MLDQDTKAIITELDTAIRNSGLSQAAFARALGTSSSRMSTYCTGKVAPSAAFLNRAKRISSGLAKARHQKAISSLDAARSIEKADTQPDASDAWTLRLLLSARDRLREILQEQTDLASAWEAQPTLTNPRWNTILAAFIDHEFQTAGMESPAWSRHIHLTEPWTMPSMIRTENETRSATPEWLAERNIFIADRALTTA